MYEKLFTPFNIGSCTIKNRLVVPAMVTNYCDDNGDATERYIAYHEAKAKGGWGLIIAEDYAINPTAKGYTNIPGLFKDEQISSHKRFTDRIHAAGAKVFCQIYHPGKQSCIEAAGVQPIAPSVIPCPIIREYPREMTIDEIHQIIKEFGATARRAKEAGFDGIELHAGHGYLLAEFLSLYINHRFDEYGGCLESRAHIIKEIMDEMRSQVGKDYPIIIRFSAFEDVPGGRDISETRVLAKLFEKWGFDALHVSNGVYHSSGRVVIASYNQKHALGADYAKEVKEIVNIPVITVNRINDPLMADGILVQGKADFIAMGRGSIADPELPNKAQNGEFGHIRYCIGCLQGCANGLFVEGEVSCLVNPEVGKEYIVDYTKVSKAKKIAVVGAGPAGLEAAITAARRGHEVDLYESRDRIGGQFVSAAYGPNKGDFTTFLTWANWQIREQGIHLLLNKKADVSTIKEGNYDEVIITTGGKPIVPPIKGINLPHVKVAEDVLVGKEYAGNSNVIAGGGEVGCETAAFLASIDRASTVIEMRPNILNDLVGTPNTELQETMRQYHVATLTGTKLMEIREDSVIVEDADGQKVLPCDTVILAFGYTPDVTLANELEAAGIQFHKIAGAVKTSTAYIANREGYELGMRI